MDVNDLDSLDGSPQLEPLTMSDSFFSDSQDTEEQGVSWQRKWLESFDGYADKYAEAVTFLYNASAEERFGYDQTAYPLMFLARHSIELRLKSLIRILSPQEKIKTHGLYKLWQDFDSLYNSNDKNDESYRAASKVIKELNDYDETSEAFRYHTDNRNNSIAKDEFIDIEHFYATFVKLNDFFYGLSSCLQDSRNRTA